MTGTSVKYKENLNMYGRYPKAVCVKAGKTQYLVDSTCVRSFVSEKFTNHVAVSVVGGHQKSKVAVLQ